MDIEEIQKISEKTLEANQTYPLIDPYLTIREGKLEKTFPWLNRNTPGPLLFSMANFLSIGTIAVIPSLTAIDFVAVIVGFYSIAGGAIVKNKRKQEEKRQGSMPDLYYKLWKHKDQSEAVKAYKAIVKKEEKSPYGGGLTFQEVKEIIDKHIS